MPLLSLWQSNPAAVGELAIEQIVATAGDGNLKDGSVCSQELQRYLSEVSSEKLAEYVDQCLSSKVDRGGMVLQDLINELGRRLEYKVENGRYQGTPNTIGFDGIWVSPEGHTIVAEVKTTDTYRIALDTVAGYRRRLVDRGSINGGSSILIVVGRQDTGELEAQVRGSQHAWDIRLISAEALIKLVKLKENSEEPETGGKIRSVLAPVEYTRLDRLVDVMFTAASDVETLAVETAVNEIAGDEGEAGGDDKVPGEWQFTDPTLLQKKREQIITAASNRMGTPLIKKSRALYWSADHSLRIAATISKRYSPRAGSLYWYAYHPQWREFLTDGTNGYLVLGCMDLSLAFAIPRNEIHQLLTKLNTTNDIEGAVKYWHLKIAVSASGDYELVVPKAASNLSLSPFKLGLLD